MKELVVERIMNFTVTGFETKYSKQQLLHKMTDKELLDELFRLTYNWADRKVT